jgi:hypothetical protein
MYKQAAEQTGTSGVPKRSVATVAGTSGTLFDLSVICLVETAITTTAAHGVLLPVYPPPHVSSRADGEMKNSSVSGVLAQA